MTPMSLSSSVVPSCWPFMVNSLPGFWRPTCITLHFFTLNSIPHFRAQLHSSSKDLWSLSMSSWVSMVWPTLVSSANFFMMSSPDAASSMSLMKIRNNNGPSTLPCGTPDNTSIQVENSPFRTTHWVLPVSQSEIHFQSCPRIPWLWSFFSSRCFGTISKAFAKSRKTMSAACPRPPALLSSPGTLAGWSHRTCLLRTRADSLLSAYSGQAS